MLETAAGRSGQQGRRGPLAGLQVIDLTHMLSGPYATWIFGALGAEVIKVEMPGRGDFTREIAPFVDGESIYFMSINRNKKSICLNLKTPQGKEALLRIVARSDVFIENNRPGVMSRLGLDYDSVSAVNPGIVYASISGFGQTGPYAERPAFDTVIQAMSGMMSITGEEERPPSRVGASIADIGGGLFGIVGILAALAERSTTGKGMYVDISMFDAQIAVLENALARLLNTGVSPGRLGTRHPVIAPFQAFATKDRPIVVCVDTEAQWRRFCQALGHPYLVGDMRFKTNNDRVRHSTQLEPLLTGILIEKSSEEWLKLLEAAEVPAGPINGISSVVEDPHVAARGLVRMVGDRRFVAQPIKFSAYRETAETPAPRLGEHTQSLLSEYGFSEEEIASMEASNVI